MKRISSILLCAVCTILMTSCSSLYNFVQVVKTQPVDTTGFVAHEDGFHYNDNDLTVNYFMWSNNGVTRFYVYNLSNKIMYIDKAKSFFIRDGFAYNYYEERTFTESNSSTVMSGSSKTETVYASRGVSASYGYLGNFGFAPMSRFDPITSSASASRSVGASVSTTSSTSIVSGHTSSTAIKEQQILIIPPKSGKYIDAFQITDEQILDCDLQNYPKENSTIKYNSESSPITFANYITYRLGENGEDKTLRHEFYVSEVSNYAKYFITTYEKRADKCDAVLTPTEQKNQKNAPSVYDAYISIPTEGCFYVTYKVWSYDRLYKEPYNGTRYYWNSQYNGYTTSDSSSSAFFVPRMDK